MKEGLDQSKISVCMATRNGEQYIEEQLSSILSQLWATDEVVISDDSSDDGTIEVIKSFNDQRVHLLEGNRFFCPVRNFENALKHASGDIIVLSDQDDIWLENKCEIIRERFRHKVTSIYLLTLDGCVVDETGRITDPSLFLKIHAGKGLVKNIYDNTYMGCCMAFSRPLLNIALPFPKRIPMHDMWLGLLAELCGTVEFVEEQTIKYRKHATSLTQFRRRFKPWIQIKRRYLLVFSLGARVIWLKFMRRQN
jgi:glycosyltransferase involved in cell wall biosynthesis